MALALKLNICGGTAGPLSGVNRVFKPSESLLMRNLRCESGIQAFPKLAVRHPRYFVCLKARKVPMVKPHARIVKGDTWKVILEQADRLNLVPVVMVRSLVKNVLH